MKPVLPLYALALCTAVTAPLLAPGYLLVRDAVSTPRSYLTDAALGVGEAAPRAVPQDFAVAMLSVVVDGGVVVKALLMAGILLAGWGAGRLAGLVLPEAGLSGQLLACTLAIWNPYVAERLLQGHWSLLLGYGCLPWVAALVVRIRTGMQAQPAQPAQLALPAQSALPAWAALAFWIALAGLTPTGLILATLVAGAALFVPGAGTARRRCAPAIFGISALAALPWASAAILGGALNSPQPAAGLSAFASRAEPGLGVLGTLAGLGGIWNADAVPWSRTTLFALPATLVLLAVVALGVPALIRRPAAVPFLVLAAAGVVLPAALATGPGLGLLGWAVDAVPGLAVLRDGQKWVAVAMPGYALAGAGAVVTLRSRLRPPVAAALLAIALIAVLPDLAWGVGGKLRPVHYPAGFTAVAAAINADPRTVAVLPPDIVRRFGWAGPAPVLDPLPRWVRADVLSTGDLVVAGREVRGEGSRARQVQRLLLDGADPAALAGAGVGWVVLESGGADGQRLPRLTRLPVVYRDADLTLYRVADPRVRPSPPQRTAVLLAHLVWAGLLLGGAGAVGVARLRVRRRR